MTEYSRMVKGKFTSTGESKVINLPFQPDSVEFWNFTAAGTPTANGVPYAYWDVNMGQGVATAQYFKTVDPAGTPTPALATGNVTSNGISTFSAGQLLQYGALKTVAGITKANPAVVTVTAHGYATGDVVVFEGLYESTTTGMPQIDGIPFAITVTGENTFTIPWNTSQSNYTAITIGATGTPRVRKVLYPYIYFPGQTFISAITVGTTTTIDTTSAHNFVVGQEVAFRIPRAWGTIELNSLPNVLTPGAPAYGYVIAVTDYNTVVVNIDSSAYTAFNSNQTVANAPSTSYPQIVAVGDVNTGGMPIYSGSQLYPPPQYVPTGTTGVNTINGPAIKGAFVNNTSQGFIIGSGSLTGLASTVLVGADGDVIYWRAYLSDMNVV